MSKTPSTTDTPPLAQTRAKAGGRRDQILDVAQGLFAQMGMAQVTTRQIAKAVGISQPSLYAHFRNADEIGEELCTRAFGELSARLDEVMAAPISPIERLMLMGRAYISFGLDNPDMYRIAFMTEGVKPCISEPLPQDAMPKDRAPQDRAPQDPVLMAGLQAFEALHRVVADLRGADDGAAWLVAQSLWAHMHGLVSLLIARPQFPWGPLDLLIERHLAVVPSIAADTQGSPQA